jgi:hypothetical protein
VSIRYDTTRTAQHSAAQQRRSGQASGADDARLGGLRSAAAVAVAVISCVFLVSCFVLAVC